MPDVEAPLEAESGTDLDTIISGALENYEPEGARPVEPEAAPVETKPIGELSRDEHGRFAKSDSAEAKPSQEPATAKATPQPTGVEPLNEPIQPPTRWSEPDKAEFAKLPREAQSLLLARHNAIEGDYTRKTQELSEQRKQHQPLLDTVGRWSPYFQQIGMTPEQALNALANAEYTLRNGQPAEKQAALAKLAQDYGISFTGQETAQQQQNPYASQLQQLSSQVQQLVQHQEVSETQRIESDIAAFSQAKDQSGNLQYPHFERVRQTMGRLIDSGFADDLPTAYAKAVRHDDELFKQAVDSERKRASDEAEKARVEAVEKAKKATPVRSSDGSPKGGTQLKGLDAHLNAALERSGLGG